MDDKLDKSVRKLLKAHKSLQLVDKERKVRCELTGHEMPCTVQAIEAYINGKRFQRLSSSKPKLDPIVFKDFLVLSNKPGHEKQLFCKLTCRHLNDLPHHIAQHINGKRFLTAYERWKKCQETGEVFKPNSGRQKQARRENDSTDQRQRKRGRNKSEGDEIMDEDDADNEGKDDDVDSLSDLYPVDYFDKLDIANGELTGDVSQDGTSSPCTDSPTSHVAQGNSKVVNPNKMKRKIEKKKKPPVLKSVKAKKSKT